jgi:hypothetical protein
MMLRKPKEADMESRNRREFLADVGKGMLTASMGSAMAADLGLNAALADTGGGRLQFGRLEPLAALMQENSAEKMLPLVVQQIGKGTSLRDVVAAAALANARTFGGEDYVGFHAFMALAPAYEMTKELDAERRALPVLKVLYRSTNQIASKGGVSAEVLHPMDTPSASAEANRESLRDAMRSQDMGRAETLFAGIAARSAEEAFNDVQGMIQDDTDVHRTVLAYRAWDLLGLTGREHAQTTLRQSVHYCVDTEKRRIKANYPVSGIRAVLPKIVDKYGLAGKTPGARHGDDAWLKEFRQTLVTASPDQAAEAVAAALVEGYSIDAIGEALSLGSAHLVIHDPGRSKAYPGKPVGSVHGDSVGVHASDSMNAWRNMAKASNAYNALTGLVVAGYHLAFAQRQEIDRAQPYSVLDHGSAPQTEDHREILRQLEAAIRENDQARASVLASAYGKADHAPRPIFDLLLRYAVSEDGALHAEKYYRTVHEEFGRTRHAFRWEHVTALARVTASEFGKRADGYEQACDLLRVKA